MANKNSQVAGAGPAGALAGARQQNPVCSEVKNWIDDLRSDMYVAVAVDRLVGLINGYLETAAQEHGAEAIKITKEDVYVCLKYDDTVRMMDVDGKEVLWLWDGWRLYSLIHKAARMAAKEGEVAVAAGI
jgi:hypothetical protein